MADITLQPMQPHQVLAVKDIILHACVELQLLPCATVQEADEKCRAMHEFKDLENAQEVYSNKSILLVMLDKDVVIGSGAIKRLDDTTCEVKRMFFAQAYRGQGLGSRMLQELVERAKHFGYKHMKLDVYNPSMQSAAVGLYKKFGFYEIPAYKKSVAPLYMQKDL